MSALCASSSNGPSPTPTPSRDPVSQPPRVSRSRRRIRRIRRPAENSLYDLLHEHAGTSLLVRPICWTDLHTQLLGAQFQELSPCDTPQPVILPGTPPSKGHMHPSRSIISLSNALTQILQPDAAHPLLCSNSIKTVFMTMWPEMFSRPQYQPKFHLYFGGRVYLDSVRAQIMWNFPSGEAVSSSSSSSSSSLSFRRITTRPADSCNHSTQQSTPQNRDSANLPMMCYIGKSELASLRRDFRIAPGPGGTRNDPVWRLRQLKAKMLMPANSDHDVYFVGLFLAMAQNHFYAAPTLSARRDSPISPDRSISSSPNFRNISLRILTHDTDTSEFIVYTGHITAEFLEKFHNPYKAPAEDKAVSGIKIEYTRVPIWPILGLRERLRKALGEDVVGHSDSKEMETWESDEDEHEPRRQKREASSEALDNSVRTVFENEPTCTAKRRCLGESASVRIAN